MASGSATVLWGLLEWGTGGLGPFKIDAIIQAVDADAETWKYLKYFCQAVEEGQITTCPTVKLIGVNTLDAAVKQGKWIYRLTLLLGGMIKLVMPRSVFEELIEDESVAEKFEEYYEACKPVLQTPTGKEFSSFKTLVKVEKADVLGTYKPALPEIRNLHRFSKAALDKLVKDKGQKDKPLTLVLYSMFDHNGAFNRDYATETVILNDNVRVFVVEGMDVSRVQGLTAGGLTKLATEHGMDGKITQVLVAGHGGSTSIEMAGAGTTIAVTTDQKTKQKKQVVYGEGQAPLTFQKPQGPKGFYEDKDYDRFWTDFFDALVKNMEMKGGLNPKILLDACLTNSNEVDPQKLKEYLASDHSIDINAIDPTKKENHDKIRAGIDQYIKKYGSLATVLGAKTAGKATVMGANASVTASSTKNIRDTGELELMGTKDQYVGASKLQYVEFGKEPVGAMRAVIESWASDETTCAEAMDRRVKQVVAPGEYDDFIIQLLYGTVRSQYWNNILAGNAFSETAHVLHGLMMGGDHCRVEHLKDPMIAKHRDAFYLLIAGFTTNQFTKLVLYQDWQRYDPSKRDAFVTHLGRLAFNIDNVDKYLDLPEIEGGLTEILKLAQDPVGPQYRGGIILGLAGVLGKTVYKPCKDHLLSILPLDQKLPPAVTDELMGTSPDTVRKALGLPVEVVAKSSSSDPSAAPTVGNNVLTRPGKTNRAFVAPMRPERRKMTKSSLFDWAKLTRFPDDNSEVIEKFYNEAEFTVIGEVKDRKSSASKGWYMIQQPDLTVAYMRTKYF